MKLTIINDSCYKLYIDSLTGYYNVEKEGNSTISMNVFDTKLIITEVGTIQVTNEYNIVSVRKIGAIDYTLTKPEDDRYEITVF